MLGIYYQQITMASIWKEPREGQKAIRHVATMRVSLEVTAVGRRVRVPTLGLVWQRSMCSVAAMVKKMTVKSDFTTKIFYTNT